MNVLGIGVDVVETARIHHVIDRFGDRFCDRVFTREEISYCRSMKFSARHFAARFAAKEAVAKAFGTGIGAKMGWLEIEIGRRREGGPFVMLHGAAKAFADELHVLGVLASLSHSEHYAVANALVLGAVD